MYVNFGRSSGRSITIRSSSGNEYLLVKHFPTGDYRPPGFHIDDFIRDDSRFRLFRDDVEITQQNRPRRQICHEIPVRPIRYEQNQEDTETSVSL
jgi:hypothetical protein